MILDAPYTGTAMPRAPEEALARLSHKELTEILLKHAQCMNHQGGKWADLSRYRIEGFDFGNRNLEGVHFDDSLLINCSFAGSALYGASFSDTKAPGTNFKGANLVKAELFGADLQGACFDGAKLARASFIECNLERASFRGADLSAAIISECDLYEADFSDATMTHVSLDDNRTEPAAGRAEPVS